MSLTHGRLQPDLLICDSAYLAREYQQRFLPVNSHTKGVIVRISRVDAISYYSQYIDGVRKWYDNVYRVYKPDGSNCRFAIESLTRVEPTVYIY